ncbi:hypothetical protein LUZ63_015156 [Rhynchospora breviuscula]|uniref:FAD-binding PCMH-type domain-containing protein n=1 Tax=Rhynchospora breviuscula TaxID=2022672 RepID=A0A9Q0HLS6_9POAL|nr:hypothetical protein LUZ63_015156 [Rhynchospora breviuscula]
MAKEIIFLILFFLSCSIHISLANQNYQSFLHCLYNNIQSSEGNSDIIYTPSNSNYTSFYLSSIRNLRFVNSATTKPLLIIAPTNVSHVQASVVCARENGFSIRARSGGHDYEGLSYREVDNSRRFVIVDLANLREIDVDVTRGTAWVQAGATVGELYYKISIKTNLYGFPAGICPTVGIGGHISGGGFGTMLRKYGLASDNVLDALLVDANGDLLHKDPMGEDLFWAIRGGGGTSYGIVVSWKVKLVPVPPIVTVFTINRVTKEGAIDLMSKWQSIAPRLHEDLLIRIVAQQIYEGGERQVQAGFNALFLGECVQLVELMETDFPELGMQRQDCKEMSWIESALYFAFYTSDISKEALLDRGTEPYRYFKAKSDFVKEPIQKSALEKVLSHLLDDYAGVIIMDPYGAKMDNISDTATPFPHRKGNLYNIQYFTEWTQNDTTTYKKRMTWIRNIYDEMEPYVSTNPRAAYINYRDLDLGINELVGAIASYDKGKIWGEKYFKGNFEKLALVKARVDPFDFFWNEQSVPPLFAGHTLLSFF